MDREPLRSILAATDLSETSDAVVEAATRLAELTGADLYLLHAFELPTVHPPRGGLPTEAPRGALLDAATALRDQMTRLVPHGNHRVLRKVVVSPAAEAITEEAATVSADLIVLGPHRRRGPVHECLGSTADRVIRTAGAPCLVVRGPVPLPLRRVLVPMDLSAPARGALEVALSWSLALGAVDPGTAAPAVDLRVLHVVRHGVHGVEFPLDRAVLGPELDDAVSAARARVRGAGEMPVREEIVWGEEPSEEIVAYAEGEAVDLVVLGTHGDGAIRRTLIGSVASRVARRSTTPVLLVPPAAWDEGDGTDRSRAELPAGAMGLAVG